MIPRVTGGDMVNIRATYTKLNSKFCLRFTIRQAVDNFGDLRFGQLANGIGKGDLGALNMLPRFTTANLTNRLWEKVKPFRNFSVRQTLITQIQDFNDLFFGNPGVVMFCAAWSAFACARMTFSTFLVHIGHVISLCAKEKMFWVYAIRRIAMMANEQIIWDRSIVQFPAIAMNKLRFASSVNLPMTEGHGVTSPKPASLSFLDFIPEAIFDWNGLEQAGTLPTAKVSSAAAYTAEWYREFFSALFANTGSGHTLFAPIKKPFAGGIGAVVSSKRTPRQRAKTAYNICARFPNYALAR